MTLAKHAGLMETGDVAARPLWNNNSEVIFIGRTAEMMSSLMACLELLQRCVGSAGGEGIVPVRSVYPAKAGSPNQPVAVPTTDPADWTAWSPWEPTMLFNCQERDHEALQKACLERTLPPHTWLKRSRSVKEMLLYSF